MSCRVRAPTRARFFFASRRRPDLEFGQRRGPSLSVGFQNDGLLAELDRPQSLAPHFVVKSLSADAVARTELAHSKRRSVGIHWSPPFSSRLIWSAAFDGQQCKVLIRLRKLKEFVALVVKKLNQNTVWPR